MSDLHEKVERVLDVCKDRGLSAIVVEETGGVIIKATFDTTLAWTNRFPAQQADRDPTEDAIDAEDGLVGLSSGLAPGIPFKEAKKRIREDAEKDGEFDL
ncbi:MAG TPA: hypothetical protein ENK57_03865 [Polyangiaceae bacterium]|nr:hypothetical protein [Polyangiaceae bacterium]